jgi:NAD(P)-dependent dehydrogenase (short-subunit alcohol dehydrogenase family)
MSGVTAVDETSRLGAAGGGRALAGRTALVTGGSRGIGRAIAERLAGDGARVAVHYGSDETAAKDTVAAIEAAGGTAFALRARLGEPGDAEALWAAFDAAQASAPGSDQAPDHSPDHSPGLDILVNNAGVSGLRVPLGEVTEEAYDQLFAVNVKAPFFITQLGLERLRDGGRIINISTGLTHGSATPELITYTATKGALDTFTQTLAKQLGPRGITVNSVAPGVVDTDMNAAWLRGSDEAWQAASAISALGRVGRPGDIADAVAFLASDHARWVTGHWLDATGGSLL